MKTIKIFSTGLLVMLAALVYVPAFAGGIGNDVFGSTHTLSLGQATFTAPAQNNVTNGPFDIRMFDGPAQIIVTVNTNAGTAGSSLNVSLLSSPDQLTQYTVPYALATNWNYTTTNIWYPTAGGTALTNKCIDIISLPYNPVLPAAAFAGFAPPYGAQTSGQFLFTNTSSIFVTNIGVNTSSPICIGVEPDDAYHNLYIVFAAGAGVATNFTASAVMIGHVSQQQVGYPY